MPLFNLVPKKEYGDWICSDSACGEKVQGEEAEKIKNCPKCGKRMYFEPYLKGGPNRGVEEFMRR